MIKLTLNQSGFFDVYTDGNRSNQCGPLGNSTNHYVVQIECRGNDLCAQGFIVDNTRLQRFFEHMFRRTESYPSCEAMAVQACTEVAMWLQNEGREPTRISVEIGPAPNREVTASRVTAEWRA